MRLIKPSAEIISMTEDPLGIIEAAGRTCYKSEDKINSDSARKFAYMIIGMGHESVIEHASATVRFICDRGVTHEIVRHRLSSYSQESTRYCSYAGEVSFIIPPWCYNIEDGYWHSGKDHINLTNGESIWLESMLISAELYNELLMEDWTPEQARSVLPNSLKTELVMTANMREWRHFFKLRTAKSAHPQMRELTIPLLEKFKERVPVIFDDILS